MAEPKVTWLSAFRSAQCAPNPDFPDGMFVDITLAGPGCEVKVPYPAPCCGFWLIECQVCGSSVCITAAGRPDDPHTVKIPCQLKGRA